MTPKNNSGISIVPGMRVMDWSGPGDPSEGVVIATAANGVIYRLDAGPVSPDDLGDLWTVGWDTVAICAEKPVKAEPPPETPEGTAPSSPAETPAASPPLNGKIGPWSEQAVTIYRHLCAAAVVLDDLRGGIPEGLQDGVIEAQAFTAIQQAKALTDQLMCHLIGWVDTLPQS